MASKPLNDKARDTLARELYWAQEHAENSDLTTSQVRDRLRELATQVRADENVVIPFGETNLISAGRGRRQLKYLLYRVARPVTWRYDRLTAEQAELTKALADRLLALEAELEDLRQLLVQKDNSLGGGGPTA
jgi:hypothetical protein